MAVTLYEFLMNIPSGVSVAITRLEHEPTFVIECKRDRSYRAVTYDEVEVHYTKARVVFHGLCESVKKLDTLNDEQNPPI